MALQKLLFLFAQRQEKKAYDFVPYKFGCYSFSAVADVSTMVDKGLIIETEKSYSKANKTAYAKQLEANDKKILTELKQLYGGFSADRLTKHTYINFPYTAINSTIAHKLLDATQMLKVESAKPKSNDVVLFTIGYEGISLEEYFNRLIKNGVKVLVDVRNNPLSMKFGFSKTLLHKFCTHLGIEYVHYPEVGILSEYRQELNTQGDYDKLFLTYRKNNLSKTLETQNKILSLLKANKRIALTCFEANICQCHRKHLAESIETLKGFTYQVKHI